VPLCAPLQVHLWKTNKLKLIRVCRFWRLRDFKNCWGKKFKKSRFNLQWTLHSVIKHWNSRNVPVHGSSVWEWRQGTQGNFRYTSGSFVGLGPWDAARWAAVFLL